jgi:hypothetical protein
MQFKTEDDFREWCRSYRELFATPSGQLVLKDLIEWSGLFEDAVDTEPFRLGVREGRRQTVLRILRNLELNIDEVFAVYRGRSVQLKQEVS